MIITKEILNQKVPKDMIPTRLDSALNLYTNIHYKDKTGIIVYNINPDTWNCLYSFYELNHKFTIDNYNINIKNPTYGELIEEYKSVYQKVYEQEILPLDASINKIDGVDVVSNLSYLLKDKFNIEKLNKNLIEIVNN